MNKPTKLERIEHEWGSEGMTLLFNREYSSEMVSRFFKSKGIIISPTTIKHYRREHAAEEAEV